MKMGSEALGKSADAMTRRSLLKGASAVALTVAASPVLARPRPLEPRIDALIARMTLEEKAGQLSLLADPVRWIGPAVNPATQATSMADITARIARGEVSGLFNGSGVALGRQLQRVAVERSRLGIPLIFGSDVIHGFRTAFPIPLAEAASFDPDLAQRTARATAVEATASGIHWTFAPMVDVARDQRWGRVAEGAGEDAWLGSRFAQARVRGFQGRSLRDADALLACPKHFAGYGAVQGGMDYNTVELSDATLAQVHLPPFRAAFDAGALTTMASFNDTGGVPSTGNRHLLTETLRGRWGFRGFVVSDWESDKELIAHGYAADGADAALKALTAGCDMSMQSGLYNQHIPALVREGRLSEAVVDEAVRRVLRVKEALGLFDDPYRSLDPAREKRERRRPATVALAREAARKSVVLLKNDGALLPLAKTARIALFGPSVADKADLPGTWSIWADVAAGVTIEQGFRDALGPNARLQVVRGCDYEAALPGGVETAVAAARAADVTVLVVGENTAMTGEAASRVDIGVPQAQLRLVEAVAATGKPYVVLLRHGRALALSGAVRAAPAIMATWFLGSETGHAIADLVFGDHAPQGRLPVSFPQASGQQPFHYDHRPTGRPQVAVADPAFKARYIEATNEALYPFGHGLTYGEIRYDATVVSAATLPRGGTLIASTTVTNTGRRAAHEVAQLYLHDRVASITQPVRVLRGIRHLDLAPGESVRVEFRVTEADLGYVHADGRETADPGAFQVWIAPSSAAGEPASFMLSG